MLQFFFVGWILLTGTVIPDGRPLLVLFLSGVVLGGWAIFPMKLDNLSVFPIVREDTVLVLDGPSSVIRHPMYTSLILLILACILDGFTIMRLLAWLLLVATLGAKLLFEERLLAERCAEYSQYQQRSWRLLPFLY